MHIVGGILCIVFLWMADAGAQLRQINLPTNDLIYDPVTQKLYASVPSSAGTRGNSITVIDPATGQLGPSIFVGSEPGKLAITSDSSAIYVSVATGTAVRRFDIASLTPGAQFSLGNDSFFGPYRVEDMIAIPGTSSSVVISRQYNGVSPRHAGVAVFDNGVQRPTTTPGHTGSNVIEISASPTRIYGYNNETTEFGFRRLDLNPSGISVVDATGNLFSGFSQDIRYDNSRVYNTCGDAIDPEARVYLGRFNVFCPSLVRPDSPRGLVIFLTPTSQFGSQYELKTFNEQSFLQVGAAIPVAGISGTPGSLVRWGSSGVAFRTTGNQVFLINMDHIIDATSYFPIHTGNTWTYLLAGANLSRTVLAGTSVINGVSSSIIQDSSGFVQYITSDSSGMRLHRQFEPDVPIGSVGTFDLQLTYSEPLKFANGVLSIGETVNSMGNAVSSSLPSLGVQNFSYSSSFTVVGFETIRVPAGTFNALRIDGLVIIGGEVSTSISYYAKNVGLVKEINTTTGANVALELFSTNVTPANTAVDFDGDGKSDVSIYRDGVWSVRRSSDSVVAATGLGGPTWTPVPADYDGDGTTDKAVYLNGTWVIIRSSDGQPVVTGAGGPTFTPVVGDYDGDGNADVAVYTSGIWSILHSSGGPNHVTAHGGPGWVPVPADYDGDGKTDIAVYVNGAWSLKRSSDAAIVVVGHGGSAWEPAPSDYDGDGKADIAVYMSGAWSIVRSSDGMTITVSHGGPAWVPVPADYDGDGKADVAVYNADGVWSIKRSSDGGITTLVHGGGPGDLPLN